MARLKENARFVVGSHNVQVLRFILEGGFSQIYEVLMDPPPATAPDFASDGAPELLNSAALGLDPRGAIACLKQVVVPDKAGLAALRKEVEVMKILRSARSIVAYYDSNAEHLPDGLYQVLVLMELCPNKSLLDLMNTRIREKLSEPIILGIMLDISIGVYEMHRRRMVHRDIKIENVLIDAQHHFKLCDFGSVSGPVRLPQDPQEFQMLSHDILYQTTPQYRAPEMLDLYRGFPIDEKADIWALGCFLYKLCYYTTPFEQAGGEMAMMHATFQFLPQPQYLGDLKNLIVIMLQEDPRYRPNIFQILVLLSKVVGMDVDKLAVDDFYQEGPYNFQALHEMQQRKQAERASQQKYYLDQEQRRLEYENKKTAKNPNAAKSYPLGMSQSQTLTLQVPSRSQTPAHTQQNPAVLGQKTDGLHKSTGLRSGSSTKAGDSKTPNSEYLDPATASPKLSVSSESVNSPPPTSDSPRLQLGDDLDFPNIDNVYERYPSLENFGESEPPHTTKSNPTSPPTEKQSLKKQPVAGESSERHNKGRTPVLESAEAWAEPSQSSQKVDPNAEKLAGALFESKIEARQADTEAKSPVQNPLKKVVSIPTVIPLSASDKHERPDARTLNRPADRSGRVLEVDALTWFEKESSKADEVVFPEYRKSERRSDDPDNLLGDFSQYPQSGKEKSPPNSYVDNLRPRSYVEVNRRSGSYLDGQAQLTGGGTQNQYLQASNRSYGRTNSRDNLNPWGKVLGVLPHMEASKPPVAQVAALNLSDQADHSLIDLGLPTRFDGPVPIIAENLPLLDLEQPRLDKLGFKKRISAPPPMEFREEVIDFASDDETEQAGMSRIAIRQLLRKSLKGRKPSEKTDEGRKRLSFLGREHGE